MNTLRESTQLPQSLESLLQARSADAIFVVGPDYRIVHWDARTESLTGLLAEEMVGKDCREVLQGECEEGATPFGEQLCSAMRLAEAGRSIPGYEMRMFTRSGGKRWVGVSTLAVGSDKGPYLAHFVRDSQKAHDTLEMARALIRLSSCAKGAPVPDRRDVPALTPRQLEVLGLLAAGRSVKEIGERLYLSQATVRNHVRSLLQALGAHSQLEALAKAREVGLLPG